MSEQDMFDDVAGMVGPVVVKETKTNGTLTFRLVSKESAKRMTVANHYSHSWHTCFGKVNVGVFRDGKFLGVAVFGHMMNPASFKGISENIENGDDILELNRLWIDDELGHNTETTMMAACFKIIKQAYPNVKCVQSFADGRLGCGTIYKAANFDYYGYHTTLFNRNIETNKVTHGLKITNGANPGGQIDQWKDEVDGKFEWFEVRTYRYIYWLDKKAKKGCPLTRLPYPEYHKGNPEGKNPQPTDFLVRMYALLRDRELEFYSESHAVKTKALLAERGIDDAAIEVLIEENKAKYPFFVKALERKVGHRSTAMSLDELFA